MIKKVNLHEKTDEIFHHPISIMVGKAFHIVIVKFGTKIAPIIKRKTFL